MGGSATSLTDGSGGGFQSRSLELHGREVIYRMTGNGPPVVLIHGLVNSSRHWAGVARRLAARHTVIAPDLLGHGDSAKPVGDYSLGAHAAGIRDLLSALEIDRATLVGHSIGGGIAMQFFYQFPERCERFALVSSGGLGTDVSAGLRAVSLPGAGGLLAIAARRRVLGGLERAGGALTGRGLRAGAGLAGLARSLRPLEERAARRAFLETLRAVVNVHGQRVSARDRLYLAAGIPTLIVWGDRDRTIPIEHGRFAQAGLGGCRFETVHAGHFPHLEQPAALAAIIEDFIATTEPGWIDETAWRRLLAESRNGHGSPVELTAG